MYEGKNIHFSPADQRPLCSFSGKICKQRRLNGYAFCLRHILEDPTAPYKRCINIAKNGQRCGNVIPQSRKADFCNSHVHAQANNQAKLQVPTAASVGQNFNKAVQPSNGTDCGALPTGLHAMQAAFNNNVHLPTITNGPEAQYMATDKLPSRAPVNESASGLGDPYDFPSDPEPPRAARPPISYGAVTHPFPNLSQALANLAAGNKVGQPQLYEGNRMETGVSSIARLYPELADKLDIGKKSPKSETKAKNTCSSPSNNKSSRTMNRLQTKIAQNKIKDKLKKSSNVMNNSSSNSPNSSLSSSNTSVNTSQINNVTLNKPTSEENVKDAKVSTSKKRHSSSSADQSSSHKPKSRNKTKSKSAKNSNNNNNNGSVTPKSEPLQRPVGQFPTLESQLQTTPLVTPWPTGGFSVPPPNAALVPNEGPGHAVPPMGPAVPYMPSPLVPEQCFLPASNPNNQLEAGRTVCSNMEALRANFPFVPVPLLTQAMATGAFPPMMSPTINNCSPKISNTVTESAIMCSGEMDRNVVDTKCKTNDNPVLEEPATPHSISGESKTLPPQPPPPPPPLPPCVRFRQYQGKYSLKDACQKIKRQSAFEICCAREKRKRLHIDLIPTGVDSSEDDASDYEELVPCQKEWLISSSSESDDDEDFLDDPLLANIRHTKQTLLHTKLRRCFLQTQKAFSGNTCLNASRHRDVFTLLKAARSDPVAAAEALKFVLHVPKVSEESRWESNVNQKRSCLCTNERDKVCTDTALPYTNQCKKHIMYNVDQQLYDYCTAKFSDNTQCCVPVFDIRHELPLCPEHAAKAENYQKNLEASRPKKPRKKTKPSALTRPPKKGKKKKVPTATL